MARKCVRAIFMIADSIRKSALSNKFFLSAAPSVGIYGSVHSFAYLADGGTSNIQLYWDESSTATSSTNGDGGFVVGPVSYSSTDCSFYQALYDFDTSSIPSDGNVISAKLKITDCVINGASDPFDVVVIEETNWNIDQSAPSLVSRGAFGNYFEVGRTTAADGDLVIDLDVDFIKRESNTKLRIYSTLQELADAPANFAAITGTFGQTTITLEVIYEKSDFLFVPGKYTDGNGNMLFYERWTDGGQDLPNWGGDGGYLVRTVYDYAELYGLEQTPTAINLVWFGNDPMGSDEYEVWALVSLPSESEISTIGTGYTSAIVAVGGETDTGGSVWASASARYPPTAWGVYHIGSEVDHGGSASATNYYDRFDPAPTVDDNILIWLGMEINLNTGFVTQYMANPFTKDESHFYYGGFGSESSTVDVVTYPYGRYWAVGFKRTSTTYPTARILEIIAFDKGYSGPMPTSSVPGLPQSIGTSGTGHFFSSSRY